MKKKSDFMIVDLFCGPGGLSTGFESAGFRVGLANDIDTPSVLTFAKNHPHIPPENIVLGDIVDFMAKKRNELKSRNFAVVVGGPPCQGFSMANRQRLIKDPRNILYEKFIEVIDLARPLFIVMENVKGMMSVAGQVVEDFAAIGYHADFKLLNAKDFGIPQHRERLIYIGAHKKLVKNAEQVINDIFKDVEAHKKTNTVPLVDALWGLRKLSARAKKGDTTVESAKSGFTKDVICKHGSPSKYVLRVNHGRVPVHVYNHKARYNNDRDLEIFRLLPPGMKSDHHSIEHIMPYKSRSHIFKDKYYRLDPAKPAKTITSHMKFDCNMYIHPFEARGITPREAARLQSFADDYVFEGRYTQWYAQVGNAVPPLLGEVIAASIMKKLV